METAVLLKLNKTKEQEEWLNEAILSPWVSRIVSKPINGSPNIEVTIFDEMGRDYKREITPNGEYLTPGTNKLIK